MTTSKAPLRFALCAVALTMVLAAGCGSSSSTSSSADPGSTTVAPGATSTTQPPSGSNTGSSDDSTSSTITITNFKFGDPVTVAAGATVTVKNADTTAHTVASDTDNQFDTGDIAGGAAATFTAPMAAGKYAFHCNIHNYMQGSLTVSG